MSAKEPVTLLEFDADEYRYLLEEFEMSDDEKDEFLQTLWNILTTFVDIGFGLDSVQLASGVGENFSGKKNEQALTDSDDKKYSFNKAANQ